jgi:hypothetical protein
VKERAKSTCTGGSSLLLRRRWGYERIASASAAGGIEAAALACPITHDSRDRCFVAGALSMRQITGDQGRLVGW